MLFFWWILKRILYHWNPDLIYAMLRWTVIMFLLPIGFLAVYIHNYDVYLMGEDLLLRFAGNDLIALWLPVLVIFWTFFTIINLTRDFYAARRRWQLCKVNIPEEEPVSQEVFAEIYTRLGIKSRVEVWRNEDIQTPLVIGFFHYQILLPMREYTREELVIIFMHELSHCKGHDLRFKFFSILSTSIACFNPPSYYLLRLLGEWSEYNCDVRALAAMKGEITDKEYFASILHILPELPDVAEEPVTFSLLGEDKSSLERRIDFMINYRKIKKVSSITTFVLAAIFACTSMTTAYAAGVGVTQIHDTLYENTEVTDLEDGDVEENLTEYYLPAIQDHCGDLLYAVDEGIMLMGPGTFAWNIPVGSRYCSNQMTITAGTSISVSATVRPTTSSFWLGIMDAGGNVRYVVSSSAASYTFPITKTDKYRVIVQNQSSVKISAAGSYNF